MKNTRENLGFLIALLVGCATQSVFLRPAFAQTTTQVSDPCGPAEKWNWGSEIPAAWRSQLSRRDLDRVGGARLFAWSQVLAKTGQSDEAKLWGQFFISRSYSDLGLVALADRSYKELFARISGTVTPVSTAVWSCMARMHLRTPSVSVAPIQVQFVTSSAGGLLPAELKNRVIFDYVRRKLAALAPEASADFSAELKMMSPDSWEFGVLSALISVHQGQDEQVIQRLTSLFKSPQFRARPQTDEFTPVLHLLLARAFYQQKNWKAALAEYDRIPAQANEFVPALVEKSWTFLQAKKYPEASGAAHNLLIGKLRGVFAPDPATIIAIALFENCHFPEALKAVRIFKQFNQPSYTWLYQWKKSGAASTGLYAELKRFLERQSKVPGAIASEWVRSPIFHYHQGVLNEMIDEDRRAAELDSQFAQMDFKGQAKTFKSAVSVLKEGVRKWRGNLKALQLAEVQAIESDLATRNHQLIAQIVDTAENAQLIEAEIFNSAGEDMILAHVEDESGRVPAAKTNPKRKAASGKLNWGTVPRTAIQPGRASKVEIWDDELGSLWSDLQDRCRH